MKDRPRLTPEEARKLTDELRALLESPDYTEAVLRGRGGPVKRPSEFTYFILIDGPELGPVKIGCASDPAARLAQLQTASPYELTLIGYVPGGEALERDLHRRYAPYRLRGEWYQLPEFALLEIYERIMDDGVAVMEGLRDD